MKAIILAAVVLSLTTGEARAQSGSAVQAARLAELINAYRSELGLPAIPVSPSLTKVAVAHVLDLEKSTRSPQCNLHSWSSAGRWTPCCYTADHARAQCMWTKPREITRGAYTAHGYEIAHSSSGGVTPEGALSSWQASQSHHEVIINKGTWATSRWLAMGVAVSERYAVVWFGQVADTASRP